MLAAQGLDIKRSILAFWVGYAAAELKPIYLRLRELISYIDLEQRTLQTIDNPFGTRLSPMS
jgi:transposase